MKRLIILMVLITAANVYATGTPFLTTSDTLNIPVVCMDTLGRKAVPDSAHVLVYFQGAAANETTFTYTNSGAGATGDIDSTVVFGVTYYKYLKPIASIDGDAGVGLYNGIINLWDEGEPTPNPFSFYIVATEPDTAFGSAVHSLDSLQDLAGWVAQEGSLFDPANDSVIVDGSALAATADAITSVTLAANSITSSEIGTGAIDADAIATGAIGATEIATDAIGAAELAADAAAEIEDSVHANAADYKATGFSTFDPATDIVVISDTNANGDTVGLMPNAWSADDSTAFQGAAGSLDSATVYGAVIQGLADSTATIGAFADTTRTALGDSIPKNDSGYVQVNLVTTTDTTVQDSAGRFYTAGSASATVPDSLLGDVSYIANNQTDYKATGFSTFDPATSAVTVYDTTATGESLAVLSDSSHYQGSASSLDSTAVYGAVAQANVDSSISTFDPATDIVTVSDTTESGDSLAVLADSSVYQGAAGSLDSTAVYGAVTQANVDSSISTFDPTTDIVTVSDTTESGDSLAVLADSASYQGSAAGLDSATVYGAVIQGLADSTATIGDFADTTRTALGDSLFDPATDIVTVADTTASGESLAVLSDSAAYQGSASGLDSATVYGAVTQAAADSSISTFDPTTDIVTVSDTTESGDSLAVLPDSASYQGSGADSTTIYGAMAQAIGDSLVSNGSFVIADTNANGDTVAVMPDAWSADDSTAYQGSASGLDSAAVYGAVTQANVDSSISTFDPSTDIVTASDTTESGESLAVLSDSASYQGSASGLDSATVYGAVTQANADSGISTFNAASDKVDVQSLANDVITASSIDQTVWTALPETVKTIMNLSGMDIRLAGYSVIGTVEDSSGNTSTMFQTDLTESTDDAYNWGTVIFIAGNHLGQVRPITNYDGTNGIIYISPGLYGGAPNAGDSFAIGTSLAGVLPDDADSTQMYVLSGYVAAAYGSARGQQDSTDYTDDYRTMLDNHGGGSGSDTTAILAMLTGNGFARIYTANGGSDTVYVKNGGTATIPDSLTARIDSILTSVGYTATSIQSKIGGFGANDRSSVDSTLKVYLERLSNRVGGFGENDRASSQDSALRVYIMQLDEGKAEQSTVDSIYANLGTGGGANTCSLWVYDTGNTVMVSDVYVRADNASGADQGHNRTNTTGIAILNLDDGTYYLRIPMNTGYIQTTNPQTFTVSGATNDTINVTWFSPSAPAGDLCTVYNYLKDADNDPIPNATITAVIPTNFWPIRYEGQAVRARYSVKTDATGLWQMAIYPNSLLLTAQADSASYWLFKDSEGLYGTDGYKVTVPDSSTFFMVPDSQQ